jgi:uncharacterized membrane protein YhiD involved in acid resistance
MNAEIWASSGIGVATLVLFILPAVVCTWYALEHMIDDKQSYERLLTAPHFGRALLLVG